MVAKKGLPYDAFKDFAPIAQGNDVIANSPEEFARVIRADAERWGGIGRKLGIQPNLEFVTLKALEEEIRCASST